MPLSTKHMTRSSSEIPKIKELLYSLFPENELLPFWFLLCRAKNKDIDFLALYDGDIFVGFTYLVTNDTLTFVLYLAIDGQIQSKGYGSKALDAIKALRPKNRIILNIEAVESAASNYEQRKKRKAFYEKNGFKNASMALLDKKERYEVLINRGDSTVNEYQQVYRKLTGPLLYWLFKPNLVRNRLLRSKRRNQTHTD